MPQSGLLWVNSKITKPAEVSEENFAKWYDDIHVPDVLKTPSKMIASACRYESIDPSADRPYLAIYPVKDMKFLETEEFLTIPVTDDLFPGPSHLCFDYVDFDTRLYDHIDTYEKEGVKAGPTSLIMSAALSPALGTEDDFNAWYQDEHYRTLAECPGYVRTRRYKFAKSFRESSSTPTFLALHEFDGENLPVEDLQKTAETEWAKKVMGGLVGQEIGVYKLRKGFGEAEAKL